jgi:hypothetical protein
MRGVFLIGKRFFAQERASETERSWKEARDEWLERLTNRAVESGEVFEQA